MPAKTTVENDAFQFDIVSGKPHYLVVRYAYLAPGAKKWEQRCEAVLPPGNEGPSGLGGWKILDWPDDGKIIVRQVVMAPLPWSVAYDKPAFVETQGSC